MSSKSLATINPKSPMFYMEYARIYSNSETWTIVRPSTSVSQHCIALLHTQLKHVTEINIYSHFKSDNCSNHYKSKYEFQCYKVLAGKEKKTAIAYYCVSGHGKGLTNAIWGFGVRSQLRKAIITYNEYLNEAIMEPNWFYMLVDDVELTSKQASTKESPLVEARNISWFLPIQIVLFWTKKKKTSKKYKRKLQKM